MRWSAVIEAVLVLLLPLVSSSAEAQTDPAQPTTAVAAPAVPKLGGYLIVRESWQENVGATASLYRARLSADGTLPHQFSYRFLVEYESGGNATTAATVSLRDAYLRWTGNPVTATFGQFKTPFSREYLTSITQIETAERAAVVDTLAPKRDIGLMLDGAVGPIATLAAGVFNGEGQNIPGNRDSTVLWVGRATLRPLSQITLTGEAARTGERSTRYGAEAHLEQSGVLLRGELIGQDARGVGRDDLGWYALLGVRVTPYLQLVGKQEDFQRPSLGQARRISATTGGVNVELSGGRTRLLANFVSRTTGFPRVKRSVVIAQAQVRF